MSMFRALDKLYSIDREHRHLERIIAALQWDQETCLPHHGVTERADQLALLEGIAHQRLTAAETGLLLSEAGSTADNPCGDENVGEFERDFLKVMRRRYDRAIKLPSDFVSNAARAEGLSQAAWAAAKKNKDFNSFLPHLRTMIDIARKKAEFYNQGVESRSLYDGLLDIYEPGMGEAEIGVLFTALRDRLSVLLQKIRPLAKQDASFLERDFPVERQAAFSQRLMDYIGFDSRRGRLDVSSHPFAATLGADDVRITTRYFPNNMLSGLFSVVHESGHAFYEMGLPPELRGTCLADGASMAIHESQSRFWENVIGRSRHFWEGLYPLLQGFFPDQLINVPVEHFYRAVNEVNPSLIRVDADEVSYSLHIILRFELEQQLISGTLEPEQLPDAWNDKMKQYLGLDNAEFGMSNAECVLQDIHWSMGAFGYFPSYALGNLYGAHFSKKLNGDISDLAGLVSMGKFNRLHEWLGDTIYKWGCRLEPAVLLQKITGEKISAEPFLEYIEEKYKELYNY
jgi:carboxypeptidase Taq